MKKKYLLLLLAAALLVSCNATDSTECVKRHLWM